MSEYKKGQRVKYKKGQRVKVELEGEIRNPDSYNGCAWIVAGDGEYSHYVYLDSSTAGVKVTLADPEDWPPQVGDIWEADGKEWFVRKNTDSRVRVVFVSEDNDMRVELENFKALNPVLVRRRGQ